MVLLVSLSLKIYMAWPQIRICKTIENLTKMKKTYTCLLSKFLKNNSSWSIVPVLNKYNFISSLKMLFWRGLYWMSKTVGSWNNFISTRSPLKRKDNGTNEDLQNISQKSKDWATRSPLRTEGQRHKQWSTKHFTQK